MKAKQKLEFRASEQGGDWRSRDGHSPGIEAPPFSLASLTSLAPPPPDTPGGLQYTMLPGPPAFRHPKGQDADVAGHGACRQLTLFQAGAHSWLIFLQGANVLGSTQGQCNTISRSVCKLCRCEQNSSLQQRRIAYYTEGIPALGQSLKITNRTV